MRVIKGLILFCFLGVGISACFDAPEFSNKPELTYNKIEFQEIPGGETNDSLFLYLDFKDGDGDLGYGDGQVDEPYNAAFYYLTDGTGVTNDTIRVVTTEVYDTEGTPYLLLITDNLTGKLVNNTTRNEPGYGYLPIYNPDQPCVNYSEGEVLIRAENVDASYNIVDTLTDGVSDYYLLQGEKLLYKVNPNHYNIEIKFSYFDNGDYVEFDWNKEYCVTFSGRFPVIPSQNGPLEGTIRYAMSSTVFLGDFSLKKLKISARIRDRALNVSDWVVTQSFTLEDIRVN